MRNNPGINYILLFTAQRFPAPVPRPPADADRRYPSPAARTRWPPPFCSAPSMMAFMMRFFSGVRATMSTSSFSFTSSTPRNCAAPSMPVPLAWSTVPPPAPGRPGGVHDGAGVALIRNDQQQFVTGILQGALLLPVSAVWCSVRNISARSAADAAQRHGERDAGARHVDAHFAAQVLSGRPSMYPLSPPPAAPPSRCFSRPERGQRFPHRCAAAHRAQVHIHAAAARTAAKRHRWSGGR